MKKKVVKKKGNKNGEITKIPTNETQGRWTFFNFPGIKWE